VTTRHLNWTERRRLGRDLVAIALQRTGEESSFDARFNFASLDLPPDAQISVEAYRQTSLMRFDFGTVSYVRKPASTALTEFEPPEGLLFRVKILGCDALAGRILAEADQLHAMSPDDKDSGREPLLIPRGADLGHELWRLTLGEGSERPDLQINNTMGDWRGLARSPHFLWLVYPQVLRDILIWVIEDGVPEDDDAAEWRSRWMRFAMTLPGMSPLQSDPTSDDMEAWVEDAVQSFCRIHRFKERFEPQLFEVRE
jgi:hypothetical protein